MKLPAELLDRILATPGVLVNGAAPVAPVPLVDSISEEDFQNAVTGLATENGWRWYHPTISKRSKEGFPDLVLVKQYVLWLELKTESGQPTAEQLAWGESLLAAGQDYRLVRPSDWPELVRVLSDFPQPEAA